MEEQKGLTFREWLLQWLAEDQPPCDGGTGTHICQDCDDAGNCSFLKTLQAES